MIENLWKKYKFYLIQIQVLLFYDPYWSIFLRLREACKHSKQNKWLQVNDGKWNIHQWIEHVYIIKQLLGKLYSKHKAENSYKVK